jgi:hypothetical protein
LLFSFIYYRFHSFQPASQRPTSVTKPPEDKSGLDAKQTMEENIRAMLEKRRQDLSKYFIKLNI